MKIFKVITPLIAIAVISAFSAQATDDRCIIKVDQSKKIFKALAKKSNAGIKVDGNGYFAASFQGKSLQHVKGLMNNPHIQMIEKDQRRSASFLYNDDVANAITQQLILYDVHQF